jgi:hypothetical protein
MVGGASQLTAGSVKKRSGQERGDHRIIPPPLRNWTFDTLFTVQCTVHPVTLYREGVLNFGTLAFNRQNTASPKYNENISLLISEYLISSNRQLIKY